VEILAIGSCLLTVETNCLELGDFNNCYIKVKNDLSDLEEKVDYYLKHDEEREEIAHNGLEYFNKWLSPEATINYIIDSVRSRL
jgi:spore maturation protein CgeB